MAGVLRGDMPWLGALAGAPRRDMRHVSVECGGRAAAAGPRRHAAGSVWVRLAAVGMISAAVWAAAGAQEASPCQALVEAGASAPEVRQCYLSQTQRNPNSAAAWMALGKDFHTEGETQEAAKAYKSVIQMTPDSDLAAQAHLHLGVIFHSQGELDEALDAYRESVALRPNPDTLLNMAIILHQRGHHTEALESCHRAIQVRPEYFAAYAQMAIMQQSSGDILQAIATYQQAIELKPDYGPAYFNLGTAYEHAGDLSKAIEQYQTAIQLEDSPEAANPKFHSRLAAALVEAGQLERDISQHHDVSRHCRPLGSSCKHEQHSLGVRQRDLDPSFYYNVGMVYLDTYLEFQKVQVLLLWAGAMFRRAVDTAEMEGSPYHAALFSLGAVQELNGHTGEALELYSRALTLRPESSLYSRAVKRAQTAMMGMAAAAPAAVALGPGFGGDSTLYARVDDEVVSVIDRYGCKSWALTPLRLLQRIERSRPAAMSKLVVHINPFPPLRTNPPEERIVSDHVTSIYREGGYGGVILSNSPGDLQWYTGVIPRSDADTGQLRVNMAVYDHGATHQEMRQALFAQLALLGARTNQSVDMLRLENVTNSCDVVELLLSGVARKVGGREGGEEDAISEQEFPSLSPKLVMLQVNAAVPPPVRVRSPGGSGRDGAREEGAWGCSLSEATHMMTRHGYALVQLDYSDALFVLTAHASVIQVLLRCAWYLVLARGVACLQATVY